MTANDSGGKRMRASVGLLAACAGVLVAARAEAAGPKVGLSLPTQREERWVKDRQTMEAEAKKAGIDLRVQVTDNDASKQVAQCENLISQGIKVLILAPHDASSASVIIDKASKAGIKVISYDRLVTDSPLDYYYLSFDNVKVGELQGEFITNKVPKGTYIVLAGSPTDNNAKLFREGAMKYIKPLADKGDIKIEMAVDIAGGKSIETGGRVVNNNKKDVPSVLLTPIIVTKDNLEDVLIKSGYLKKSAVYKKSGT